MAFSLQSTKSASSSPTSAVSIKQKLDEIRQLVQSQNSSQYDKLKQDLAGILSSLDSIPDQITSWKKKFDDRLKSLQYELTKSQKDLEKLQTLSSEKDDTTRSLNLKINQQKDELDDLKLQMDTLKSQAAKTSLSEQARNDLQHQLEEIAARVEEMKEFIEQENDKRVTNILSTDSLKEKIARINNLLATNPSIDEL